MYSCPHCADQTISGWRKASSSPFSPARCSVCGGESAASGWSRAVAAIGGEVLLWGSIILALYIGSPCGLLALPLGLFAMTAALNWMFPLVAIAELSAARKRATMHLGIAVFVLVAGAVVISVW
ncbi:MAG: hypothetical protein U5L02_09280 [Rheinheimera sp.]|nr:hypothetical protein [Rheinheimera sp.]